MSEGALVIRLIIQVSFLVFVIVKLDSISDSLLTIAQKVG